MSQHKVATPTLYLGIFGTLLLLTFLTTYTANLEGLGGWHVPVALGIAVTKTVLVVLFFMHLIHSPKLTWMVACSGVVTLLIMLTFTLSDYLTRPLLPQSRYDRVIETHGHHEK